MGKWFIREKGARNWRTGEPMDSVIGINLVDTTTGVFVWMQDGDELLSLCLSPDEADRFAVALEDVARQVREANA